jgi:CubicO group peptidase (beta-lactamase class C family)
LSTLPRSTPAGQGVDPSAIMRFIDAIENHGGLDLHGIMVLRRGKVIAEGHWSPYTPEQPTMLFSLSKSFTSTAVGFAVAEGRLKVDDPVLSFFPDEAPEKPGRHWKGMTVRHLLTMSTGHTKETLGAMRGRRDGDWVKGFLRQPLKHKPGTHFFYNTGATYMLSAIVQRVTGQRLTDYLMPRLFAPLGIARPVWEQCPKGIDTGGFGLNLAAEDIARFGQFLLQRGAWEGKALLPAAWVDEASASQIDSSTMGWSEDWSAGYGYQFWRCTADCYRGDGAFGQFCVVIPRLDMVIAITSGQPGTQDVLSHIWKELLPGVDAADAGAKAQEELERKIKGLAHLPPHGLSASAMEADLDGKAFTLEKNDLRLRKLSLRFDANGCEAILGIGRKIARLHCGRESWVKGLFVRNGAHVMGTLFSIPTAASFTWEDGSTLLLTVRDLAGPYVTTFRLAFQDGGVALTRLINVGATGEPPVIAGRQA